MSAVHVLDTLRDCLTRHRLLRQDACLVAAVSGGSDSMALLAALHHLQQQIGFSLHACHVQHGLRGMDSLEDETLVYSFCLNRGIPLTVHTADLGGDLHLPGMETRARNCRRAFYAEAMAAVSADAVLLAHHQNDQTETLLLHLLRGAGTNGLSGMKEAVPFGGGLLLRPFLDLSKAELTAALHHWRIPHREDASNQEALTLRNALRLRVLPLLEELSPGCSGRMAQTARLLQQDENALSGQAYLLRTSSHLRTDGGLHAFFLPALQDTPKAIAVRALRQWMEDGLNRAGVTRSEMSLSAEDSENLLTFALSHNAPSRSLNLPGSLQVFKGSRWLHLIRQDGAPLVACQPPQALSLADSLPNGYTELNSGAPAPAQQSPIPFVPIVLPGWDTGDPRYHLALTCTMEIPETPPANARTAYVPLPLLPGCVLRSPLPGDTIHPLGAPGEKPLRRYLTDRKIDPPFRPHLPVLARGDTILWIPGLCTAHPLAYQPDTPCLRLTLQQIPPYLTTTHKGDERHG